MESILLHKFGIDANKVFTVFERDGLNPNSSRQDTLCSRTRPGHVTRPGRVLVGCLLNPGETAAVVGGNVLTSQRVVDVVLKAS